LRYGPGGDPKSLCFPRSHQAGAIGAGRSTGRSASWIRPRSVPEIPAIRGRAVLSQPPLIAQSSSCVTAVPSAVPARSKRGRSSVLSRVAIWAASVSAAAAGLCGAIPSFDWRLLCVFQHTTISVSGARSSCWNGGAARAARITPSAAPVGAQPCNPRSKLPKTTAASAALPPP